MATDILLTPSQYHLSFYYHARTNGNNDDNGIQGYLNNSLIGEISKTTDEQDQTWELIDWTFDIDNTATYTLKFTAFGKDNTLGGFIDTVTLYQNPEPSTMLLFGFGLLGFARLTRKKMME